MRYAFVVLAVSLAAPGGAGKSHAMADGETPGWRGPAGSLNARSACSWRRAGALLDGLRRARERCQAPRRGRVRRCRGCGGPTTAKEPKVVHRDEGAAGVEPSRFARPPAREAGERIKTVSRMRLDSGGLPLRLDRRRAAGGQRRRPRHPRRHRRGRGSRRRAGRRGARRDRPYHDPSVDAARTLLASDSRDCARRRPSGWARRRRPGPRGATPEPLQRPSPRFRHLMFAYPESRAVPRSIASSTWPSTTKTRCARPGSSARPDRPTPCRAAIETARPKDPEVEVEEASAVSELPKDEGVPCRPLARTDKSVEVRKQAMFRPGIAERARSALEDAPQPYRLPRQPDHGPSAVVPASSMPSVPTVAPARGGGRAADPLRLRTPSSRPGRRSRGAGQPGPLRSGG